MPTRPLLRLRALALGVSIAALAITGAAVAVGSQPDDDPGSQGIGSQEIGSQETGSEDLGSERLERVTPLDQIPTRTDLFAVHEAQRDADWYALAALRELANRDPGSALSFAETGAELGSARAWANAAAMRVGRGGELPEIPVVLSRVREFDPSFMRTRAYFEWCARRRLERLPDPDRIIRLRLHGPWPDGLGPKFGKRDRGSRDRWFSQQRSSLIRALTAGPDESTRGVRRLVLGVAPATKSLEAIALEIEEASDEFPEHEWLPVILRVVVTGAPLPRDPANTTASPRPFVASERPIVTALIDGHAPWSSSAFRGQRVWMALSKDGRIEAVAPPGMPLELLSLFVLR